MHRIERYFMRPIALVSRLPGLIFVFQHSWSVAAVLVVVWLGIGLVGQSIHRHDSFGDLVMAKRPEMESPEKAGRSRPSQLERPVMHTASWFVYSP